MRTAYWSIEQPAQSLMWELAEFRSLARLAGASFVYFDQCMWGLHAILGSGEEHLKGMRHKKPTKLLTNWAALHCLARKCDRQHCHLQLQGSVKRPGYSGPRTRLAAAYPGPLCRAWASAVQTSGLLADAGKDLVGVTDFLGSSPAGSPLPLTSSRGRPGKNSSGKIFF